MFPRQLSLKTQGELHGDDAKQQAHRHKVRSSFPMEAYFLSLFTIASLYGVLTAIMIATA